MEYYEQTIQAARELADEFHRCKEARRENEEWNKHMTYIANNQIMTHRFKIILLNK